MGRFELIKKELDGRSWSVSTKCIVHCTGVCPTLYFVRYDILRRRNRYVDTGEPFLAHEFVYSTILTGRSSKRLHGDGKK